MNGIELDKPELKEATEESLKPSKELLKELAYDQVKHMDKPNAVSQTISPTIPDHLSKPENIG